MRTSPSSAPAAPSGSDPLAELARLIGQNDPFAEFGRQNARQAVQQQPAQPAPAPAYADERYAAPALDPAPQGFAAGNRRFDNFPQQYGATPLPNFPSREPVPGFPSEAGYGQDGEYPTDAHSGAEDHDFYDDVPPRRRLGIVAIAAVLGLAVVGTAGAFGYRALFGSSGAKSPPPVIKAESSPTKIVPAAQSKDPKSGKLIYDRVAERGQDEKLVSREEQPVDRPPGAANASGQAAAPMGSGIVATEPKKVHTIAIRPDGTAMADAASTAAVASAPPPSAAPSSPSARPVAEQPRPQPAVHTEQPTRPEQPARRTVAAAPSGGPLSLSPDAPAAAPAPAAPPPTRTAVAAPTQTAPVQASAPASGGGGGYAVQVSSQRSEAEAQTAFRSLQTKYPSQLGGKQPLIRHVDLGAKGVYYRAMVGPMASEEASQLCSSLKAAGGQCIIQRN